MDALSVIVNVVRATITITPLLPMTMEEALLLTEIMALPLTLNE